MSTHEILTIQVGHYANFVGAHWWNMQEASFCYDAHTSKPLDINHDVLFREGINPQNEVTFTPRLIVIDEKQNLKIRKREGDLYANPQQSRDIMWDGPVGRVTQQAEENIFLKQLDGQSHEMTGSSLQDQPVIEPPSSGSCNFDEAVRVWSDFLTVTFHPRTVCLINEYAANDDGNPLEVFEHGVKVYNNEVTKTMVEDRVRQYIEECDYLQGFHLLTDGDNGFSGVSSAMLLYLDEEYRKKPCLSFPLFHNQSDAQSVTQLQERLHSTLLTFSSMYDQNVMFSPLSLFHNIFTVRKSHIKFPFLNYKPSLPYHTSAVLATAIETLTAPYRLKKKSFLMSDIMEHLTLQKRMLISSSMSLPFPLQQGAYLSTLIKNYVPELAMVPITPMFNPESNMQPALTQVAILRGIQENEFFSPTDFLHGTSDTSFLFGQYLKKCSPSSLLTASLFGEKCSIKTPFPNIISKDHLSKFTYPTDSSAISVAAALNNTCDAAKLLNGLINETTKKHFWSNMKNATAKLHYDDLNEALQSIMELKDNYTSD